MTFPQGHELRISSLEDLLGRLAEKAEVVLLVAVAPQHASLNKSHGVSVLTPQLFRCPFHVLATVLCKTETILPVPKFSLSGSILLL